MHAQINKEKAYSKHGILPKPLCPIHTHTHIPVHASQILQLREKSSRHPQNSQAKLCVLSLSMCVCLPPHFNRSWLTGQACTYVAWNLHPCRPLSGLRTHVPITMCIFISHNYRSMIFYLSSSLKRGFPPQTVAYWSCFLWSLHIKSLCVKGVLIWICRI